jgi:hypothetical protein
MEQPVGEGFDLAHFLEKIQYHYLIRGMRKAMGVKTKAAELLGLPKLPGTGSPILPTVAQYHES